MNNIITAFVGSGLSITEATDEAIGETNEWLASHQWRTADGISCYTLSPCITSTPMPEGILYACLITVYGPAEETGPPMPARAYTGATERLG